MSAAQVVIQIGKLKANAPVYAPDREKKVLERIAELNKGPLPDRTLAAIWRELMSGSFFLERPLRISYLGPEGSFSHTPRFESSGRALNTKRYSIFAGYLTR